MKKIYIEYRPDVAISHHFSFEENYIVSNVGNLDSYRKVEITEEEYLMLKLKYEMSNIGNEHYDDIYVAVMPWLYDDNEEILYCELLQNLR